MKKGEQLVKAIRRIESDLQEVIEFHTAQTSVRKLAREIDVSPTTISLIKHGHVPDYLTLEKIADWLAARQRKRQL